MINWFLDQYRMMYDAFFEQRELIPAGMSRIRFEQLEQDPVQEMRKLYAAGCRFADVEPAMQRYVNSLEITKRMTIRNCRSESAAHRR